MKKSLIIAATLLVAACSGGNDEGSAQTKQPTREEIYAQRIHTKRKEQEVAYNGALHRSDNLKDCVFEYLDCLDCDRVMRIVRCPQSSTSATSTEGKHEITDTTVSQ